MAVPSRQEIEAALYADESGETIGLDEVQILDNPSAGRISTLEAALSNEDIDLHYRAAFVLASWGNGRGLDAIERLVDAQVDRRGVNVPHRIYGYNNVYDEIAYALSLFGCSSIGRPDDQKRIYAKLLGLYGPHEFESRLKGALLASEFRELLPDVEQALHRALKLGKRYLASQLLPVVAKWDSSTAWQLISSFQSVAIETPNPTVNVAEALRYINSDEARRMLRQLCQHADTVVAEEARESLEINIGWA